MLGIISVFCLPSLVTSSKFKSFLLLMFISNALLFYVCACVKTWNINLVGLSSRAIRLGFYFDSIRVSALIRNYKSVEFIDNCFDILLSNKEACFEVVIYKWFNVSNNNRIFSCLSSNMPLIHQCDFSPLAVIHFFFLVIFFMQHYLFYSLYSTCKIKLIRWFVG